MDIWEMRKEISAARQTLENADKVAQSVGYLLEGRLRHLNWSTLAQFKKELKDFNAHTGTWKD